jgi:pyridoxamine 5'-phosphate oxidase family protein
MDTTIGEDTMSAFTDREVAYLSTVGLARLATIGPSGEPHVVPVRFLHNREFDTIDIPGFRMGSSKKWRDAGQNPHVAVVIDDVERPGKPRGVEVRGLAQRFGAGDDAVIRIRPTRIVSWGIDTDAYSPNSRSVPPAQPDN